MDSSGNFYGATAYGGNVRCRDRSSFGCGTVYKLDTDSVETILYNFKGIHALRGADGEHPYTSLLMDAKGNLYGTTLIGGSTHCDISFSVGCGMVFKVSGKKETVLYRFLGGGDGAFPLGGLAMDKSGTLYGTTQQGGNFSCNSGGCGVVFKLSGDKESVLHRFTGLANDGAFPSAGVLLDSTGTVYGTAANAGNHNCNAPDGCGVVFKLVGQKETILHAFNDPPDGNFPGAALIMDGKGNLYGTTVGGGDGLGTVFELSRNGKEHIIYAFGPPLSNAGVSPTSRLVRDSAGNLYGTTLEGGDTNHGIAFEVTKDGTEKVLHSFCTGDCSDGAFPAGDLIMDSHGNLYGTAEAGGAHGDGVVFMITP